MTGRQLLRRPGFHAFCVRQLLEQNVSIGYQREMGEEKQQFRQVALQIPKL
jgi:hypothetical protein